MHHPAKSTTELCHGWEHDNACGESVPMYHSSGEEAITCSNWYLYAKGWMNLDSLRFDTRYSAREIATMSYVILYILNETSKPPVNTCFQYNSLTVRPFEIIFDIVILVTNIRRLIITKSDSIRISTNV